VGFLVGACHGCGGIRVGEGSLVVDGYLGGVRTGLMDRRVALECRKAGVGTAL